MRQRILGTARVTLTRRGAKRPSCTVARAVPAGTSRIALSLRGLRTGRYRVALSASATDGRTATGPSRTLTVRG